MLKPGDAFGSYRVLELLGEGGMGAVFLLESVSGGRVAAKILDPEKSGDHASRRRFLREAELALGVTHPNLVETYDVGEDPDTGLCYILMEYVPGGSLADRLDRGPLVVNDAIRIVYQIASVLELARQNGVVHRDIKPANIMFGSDGRAKLADLGIARGGVDTTTVTQDGMMIGTPAYMSPEQMLDSHHVDIRADIYSLGVVFFEMLAGERPNAGDTIVQLMAKAVKGDPLPDVRTVRPEVPALLAKLIAMMVAPDREMRFSTPGQLMDALAVVARGGSPQFDSDRTRLLVRQILPPVGLVLASLAVAWFISHSRKEPAKPLLPEPAPAISEPSNAVVEVVVPTNQIRRPASGKTSVEVVTKPPEGQGSNVVERQVSQMTPTGGLDKAETLAKAETNAVPVVPPPRKEEEKKPVDVSPRVMPDPLPVAKTSAEVVLALKSTVLPQFVMSYRQPLSRIVDDIRAALNPRVNFFVLRPSERAIPRGDVQRENIQASKALENLCNTSDRCLEIRDNVVCISPCKKRFRWKTDAAGGEAASTRAALSRLRFAKFAVKPGQNVGDVLEQFRKRAGSEPATSGIRWIDGRPAGAGTPNLSPMELEDVSVWTALELFCAAIGWDFDCTARRVELHPPFPEPSPAPGGSSRFSPSEIRRTQSPDGEEAMRETILLLFRGWRLSDSQQTGFFRRSRRRDGTDGQKLGYVAEYRGQTDVLRTSGTGSLMEYVFKEPVKPGWSLSFSACGDPDTRIFVKAGSRIVRDCGSIDGSGWRYYDIDLSRLAGEKPTLAIFVKGSSKRPCVMHWHGIQVRRR